MLTSVVVVTMNSGAGVHECLARILASTAAAEIVVVDNASDDGSLDRLVSAFDGNEHVRILRNERNLGFGAACNRGAAVARGDALLFLNPDCLLAVDTIARLRGMLDDDNHIGAVGALQEDARGTVDPASRRRDPLLRRALATMSGLARLGARWPVFSGINVYPKDAVGATVDVDAISGALMLIPAVVFSKVGGFDEGYFLHCEDLDLSRRIRDAGYRVVCANDIRVVHRKGGSSRQRPVFVAWHKHRGMWRWFTKFDPAAHNPLLRSFVWCGIWSAFVLKLPLLCARRLFAAPAT